MVSSKNIVIDDFGYNWFFMQVYLHVNFITK